MSDTPLPSPAPRPRLGSRRGLPAGRWGLAVPLHLVLALGLVTGCTSSTASTDQDAGPVPGTVTTLPATASSSATPGTGPSPTASRTPGSVTTVTPTPAESPVRAVAPPSGAFLALEGLTVAAAGTMSDYDREALFGGWIDADGDCEDTRNEVLARDLTGITSADGCTVAAGTLADPYTGASIDFVRGVATSSDVQVDHVVSLGNAWVTGARRLSPADRVALANDPLNLLAVDGAANGAKSDLDASGWLPPNRAFACEMVSVQIAVKSRYGLWVTAPEKNAMAEVLSGCPDQQLPGGTPFGDILSREVPSGGSSGGAGDVPEAAPDPAAAPDTAAEVHYANCTEARRAGAAPLHRGDPGYRPAMDRDSDGVACE
ncbi:excalibur calcium-binding domain-containing protein [Kocuria sp. CPCC 205268]|uniref:excalibur calcium-binding domain-containing protein n=1 Tax=Kocuria oxytropis TaxID=3058913 RepID=UPI0034D602B6